MWPQYPRRVLEDPQPVSVSLEPLDDFVIVEPVDEETETKTGLIIPASSDTGCRSGIVTAVGAEAGGVEPGDKVLFPKEAGYDVRVGAGTVKLLRREELIARVID